MWHTEHLYRKINCLGKDKKGVSHKTQTKNKIIVENAIQYFYASIHLPVAIIVLFHLFTKNKRQKQKNPHGNLLDY